MQEVWKDVVGYEGYYQVSNLGHIKSLDRCVKNSNFSTMLLKGKILKLSVKPNGYCYVTLNKNGYAKYALVHRLVAEAFIDNIVGLPQVNHIDEDKKNNSVNNLEWSSCKENAQYGTRNERAAKKSGKPVVQKNTSGEILNIFRSANYAAKHVGRDAANIQACLKGKTKTCAGFRWEYV